MTKHNSSDPLSTWLAVCAEAEAIVIRDEKFLLLDEEMTFRMGEALDLAAGVRIILPEPRVTRAADRSEPDTKIAQREGYDEGWNDCLKAVATSGVQGTSNDQGEKP